VPSTSKKQRNFMAAAAHNPAFAKKAGIPVSVAKEFNQADKGRKFRSGGMAKMKHDDLAEDKKLIKKAFRMHDAQEHKGEHTNLTKLKKGGMAMKKMCGGGKMKRYDEGGDVETPTNQSTPTAASAQFKNFKDAFKSARASGDKTFEWEGKKYSTEMAKPEPSFADKAKKAGFTSAETKGGAALMTRKMASGGSVRGCGIAKKGLTKGRMV
jgi:hypothetical protein